MIGDKRIVDGGGWRSREHWCAQSWRTILVIVTFVGAVGLEEWIGIWALLLPVAAFFAPTVLFGFKPRPNVPKHDPHNLH